MSADAEASRVLLVTTALEETWELPEEEAAVLFLAPWCQRYSRRAAWEPIGGTLVADPWATCRALDSGVEHVRSVTEQVLAELGVALPEALGERWSARETRILLGPWLLSYVPAQLDRWERLSLAATVTPRLVAWGLPDTATTVPRDTLEAVQLLKSDRYNLQLMTPMMRALGIEVLPVNGLAPEPQPVMSGMRTPHSLRRKLAESVSRAALALRGGRAIAMRSPHFPREVQLELIRRLSLSAMPAPTVLEPARAMADAARRAAALGRLDLGSGDFESYLRDALVHDLPTCFLEGYPALRASADAMGRCPAAVLSANAWHYDEPFKRWVADGAETGSLLLGVQHGGNYGIDEYAPSEDHETAITDRYYTWGWTREDVRATTTPMPAPKLMTREELPADAEAEGVLFVATVASSYPTQLNTGPERFARYLARQSEFLSALPAEVAAVMRVRPHRESLGWDIAERIADAHPEIPIESWEVPFAESMKACRVFVCDHLSTTFVEALAANKPAVLFWDPAETKVRAEAAAIFEELREAGILFDDPAAAVSAVAEAYADVVTWWRDPMRVAAVAAFRERFARTDPHAIELWAAELRGVISGE